MAFWKPMLKSALAGKYGDKAAAEIMALVDRIMNPKPTGDLETLDAITALEALPSVMSLLEHGFVPLRVPRPGVKGLALITNPHILKDPALKAALSVCVGEWEFLKK